MTITQDIRYGIRVLLKSPGFVIATVVSLALGIGANTTIFTMVNSVFLQPLPVESPSELMYVHGTDSNNTSSLFGAFLPVSYPNYRDYRAQNDVFQDLGVYSFPRSVSMGGGDKPTPVFTQLVSWNYFKLLGVMPVAGRTFLEEEDKTLSTHPVAVLSYQFWQRRFGGSPTAIGGTILLNGHTFTIIGVAPRGFEGTIGILSPDLWAPVMAYPLIQAGVFPGGPLHENRRLISFNAFGRLKPSVSPAQAQTALQVIGRRLEEEYPNENKGRNVGILPLTQATIPPQFRGILLQASSLLMVIVGLVLLIACANIANLMMARATARRREFTVRLALGGARSRIVSQLLIESILVALPGGVLAVLVAVGGRNLILSLLPSFAGAQNVSMPLDTTVLAFTLVVAIVSGILFGIAPSLSASRADLVADLKERAGSGGGQGRLSIRNLLILFQVALSVIALASAGLFIRSLRNARQVDLGFEHDKLVVVQYDLTSNGYDQDRGEAFHRQILERVRAIPGVAAASLASSVPLQPPFQRTVFPEGEENASARTGTLAFANTIVPGHFQAIRIPLLRGRDFNDADRKGQTRVVVINEAMARRFWPSQDSIGKRFKFYGDQEFQTVIGLAANTKVVFVGEAPQAMAFLPLEQDYQPVMTLHVRTSGGPETLKGTIEREVQSLDRNVALTQVLTAPELLALSLWGPRMAATLLSIFGIVALILAAVGIYGVMSYSVNQRASEIGIRMALGAERSDVLRMVLRQGMTVVSIGLAAGLVVATIISSVLKSLLYGVGMLDIPTFAATAAVLVLVALVANYVPARRATKVDPVHLMRYE